MTKKIRIPIMLLCLSGAILTGYNLSLISRLNSLKGIFFGMSFGLFLVVLIILLYGSLLQYLKKGVQLIKHEDFIQFHDLKQTRFASEIINFYFISKKERNVKFSIVNEQFEERLILFNEMANVNGNQVKLDTTKLDSAVYFCQIETENQKIMRKIIIQHVK